MTIKVLFIEDETDLLEIVADALEASGMSVTKAASSAAAMDHIQGDESFDVVVSDIMMPGTLTGIDIAREVAAQRPQTAVVLTSGHPLSHFGPLPENASFLSKPYRTRQLLEALRDRGSSPLAG